MAIIKKASAAVLAVVCVAVATLGGIMTVHAYQGVLKSRVAELAAARQEASVTLQEARAAGLSTTPLANALATPAPPLGDRVALLITGGSGPNSWTTEATLLKADAAALQPALAQWKSGMGAIKSERSILAAAFANLQKQLPQTASAIATRSHGLLLTGSVPTPEQPAALAALKSNVAWADTLISAASSAKNTITQSQSLLSQATQLKIATTGVPSALAALQAVYTSSTDPVSITNAVSTYENSSAVNLLQAEVRAADPGPGKVIVIRLAAQSLTAYDNGKVVLETPVTTGRPGLTTPIGVDTIGYHESPYLFISPWPPSSPYWYEPTWVTWVMEFHAGGYFIHDAWWEPNSVYGPGSEYGPDASHGCVQTPHAAMQFLYSWTPNGTTVVVAP